MTTSPHGTRDTVTPAMVAGAPCATTQSSPAMRSDSIQVSPVCGEPIHVTSIGRAANARPIRAAHRAATTPKSHGCRRVSPRPRLPIRTAAERTAARSRDPTAGRRRASRACSGVAGGRVGAVTVPESQLRPA